MNVDEHLRSFGTPLQLLQKDEVISKKPISIEDQIVKDENGKRRFHGAFTGGFSAGYWNTVGSEKGWTPQQFKSSRNEKAMKIEQCPKDFMDEADLNEFGIAPQGIRAREDFSKQNSKNSQQHKYTSVQSLGPIPGVPALEQLLLHTVRDKTAVRMLKKMGWKPGQGIGARQTLKQKQLAKGRNKREQYLLDHYGDLNTDSCEVYDNDDENIDNDITFAPNDYDPILGRPKDNRFGLSYVGLSRAPVLSSGSESTTPLQHINIIMQLEASTAKRNILTKHGQAFGVGAFEEDDEDIYARDDLTHYDFSLSDAPKMPKKIKVSQQGNVIKGFSGDKKDTTSQPSFCVELPQHFQARNWTQRRTRFSPLGDESVYKQTAKNDYIKSGLRKKDQNPENRAKLLGISTMDPLKSCGKVKGDGVKTSAEYQVKNLQQTNTTLCTANSSSWNGFKPFVNDESKQQRYEKFLSANLQNDDEITKFLSNLQPVTLSSWEREMEKNEFIQASKIYKPFAGSMFDRFVSEATLHMDTTEKNEHQASKEQHKTVLMKRTKSIWQPCGQLCKRYNIAEPFNINAPSLKKENALNLKSKLSVFDYLETSVNNKSNFLTPTIIPKHIEVSQSLNTHQERSQQLPCTVPSTVPVPDDVVIKESNSLSKTPLERAVNNSKDKHISDKIDLFKKIFDEDEILEQGSATDSKTIKDSGEMSEVKGVLGLPTALDAEHIKMLRNNSQPQGIFSAFFKAPNSTEVRSTIPSQAPQIESSTTNELKISYKPREYRLKHDEEVGITGASHDPMYGPNLPPQIRSENINDSGNPLAHIVQTNTTKRQKHTKKEKWVEKQLNGDDIDESESACSKSKRFKKCKSNKKAKELKHKNKSKSHNEPKYKEKKKKKHKSKH